MTENGKGNFARAGIALAIAGSLAARSVFMLRRPLWFDEIFTLWISRRIPPAILGALRNDAGPPLFYFLEKPGVWLAETFRFDAGARLLPLLALALLFAVNRSRRSSGGPWFVFLLAASPLLFYYSAEARAYAPLALASFLLFLAVFRSRGGRGTFWAAATLAAALPALHYLGALVVAGSLALTFVQRKLRLAAAQLLGSAVFLAWLPTALAQPRQALGWSRESLSSSTLGFLEKVGFWGSAPGYFAGARLPAPEAGAVLGLLLLAGTVFAARKDRRLRDALAFALLPILLALAAGFVAPVFFSGRTEMTTLPVLLWAVARVSRKVPAVRRLAALAAVAGTASITLSLLRPPAPAPYGVTARFVSARSRAGDLTVAGGAEYLPLALAAERGELAGRLLGVPAALESHPGWFEPGKLEDPPGEARRLSAAAAGMLAGDRLRVAFPPDPALLSLVNTSLGGRAGRLLRPPGGDAVLELVVQEGLRPTASSDMPTLGGWAISRRSSGIKRFTAFN